MSSIHFTEEPGEIQKGTDDLFASTGPTPQSENALPSGPENFDIRWDESKWTHEILNQ
jgi:hypothetical protein